MRKKFHPLWFLIIINVILLIGTLYVTRHAISDYEYISYSQRNHYKSVAMMQMANAYFRSPMYQLQDGVGMGKFLEQTVHDNTELFFIFKWDTANGFPLVYVGGSSTRLPKWQDITSLRDGYAKANRLNIISKEQTDANYNRIVQCIPSTDLHDPDVITETSGVKYLATWVVIPAPSPKEAVYLYITYTPTASIDSTILPIKEKYIWLFSFATALAVAMLILIPIVIKRDIYDHS
jgi:hypothetical protein